MNDYIGLLAPLREARERERKKERGDGGRAAAGQRRSVVDMGVKKEALQASWLCAPSKRFLGRK